MRHVFALDYQHENPMIKLYKLCLERNAPIPIYSVQRDFHSIEGVKHNAECKALNEVGTGKLNKQSFFIEIINPGWTPWL